MNAIASTIVHSSVQIVFGTVVGTATDAIFPKVDHGASITSWTGAAKVVIEAAAQVVVDSLAVAFLVETLRTASPAAADRSAGTALFLTLLVTQPSLREKMRQFGDFVSGKEQRFVSAELETHSKKTYHNLGNTEKQRSGGYKLNGYKPVTHSIYG